MKERDKSPYDSVSCLQDRKYSYKAEDISCSENRRVCLFDLL